jgi:hypothetical protein
MRYLIILILASITSLGQDFNYVNRHAAKSSSIKSIDDITINVNRAQYIGTNVSISADTHGNTITNWKWRILRRTFTSNNDKDTTMVATSSSSTPSISLSTEGFYDIKLTARNSKSKYEVYGERIFVLLPARFTRAQADIIVNMSSGGAFLDKRGVDMSGKKIWLEGQTTNGYFECVDCHGSPGNPLRIQKASDNTQVTIQSSGGSSHPFYFSQYSWDGNGNAIPGQAPGQGARYIVFNGFNLDGTPGVKITGLTGVTVVGRVEGKLTDVQLYGIEVVSNPLTVDGAAIAVVPTVAVDCNKTNWACNNIVVYGCKLLAGEEGIYINESNQGTSYTGNHGFNPPSGTGIVVSRNTILGAGRDAIQVGSAGGEIEDNIGHDFGQQHDQGGQESCIVANSGFFGRIKRNYCYNGEMFLNIASGEYAFSPLAGQSAPQPLIIEGNVYSSGTYSAGGTDETHAIYIQNNPVSGAGNWTITFKNNIIDTDNKCAEMLLALGGYTSSNFTFANNIVIKNGTAGDTQEFNVTGNGKATLQSGTKTINNLVRNRGTNLADLYFKNYVSHDLEITSTLSAAFLGTPTNTGSSVDHYGFPIPIPVVGYFFGPYSLSNKRMINP